MNKYKKVSELTFDEIFNIKNVYYNKLSIFLPRECDCVEAELFPYYINNRMLHYSMIDYTEYPELALEVFEEERDRYFEEIARLKILERNMRRAVKRIKRHSVNILKSEVKAKLRGLK